MSGAPRLPLGRARPHAGRPARQRGFVLIVGLLMLVVLTLLSISMFRSFGSTEKVAGVTRDKQRAFEAAQSALQYGEWWLGQGLAGSVQACSSVVNANTIASMVVCSAPLATYTPTPWVPWAARMDYLPPSMTVASGGGVVTAGGDINYQAKPGLYIYAMGSTTLPNGQSASMYQVTAFGYGGNPDTVAVVQSTYELKSGATPLDGL